MNLLAVHDFIGSPWSYPDNDCWAVFRKVSAAVFDRHIPEIELPEVSDPGVNPGLFLEHANSDAWQQIEEPEPGCAVLLYNDAGVPVHIGIYIQNNEVVHCLGSTESPGSTRADKLGLLTKVYDRAEYYRYAVSNDTQ